MQQTSGLILGQNGQAQIIANHPIMARDIEGSPAGDVLSIEGSPDVDIIHANCIVEKGDFILYYLSTLRFSAGRGCGWRGGGPSTGAGAVTGGPPCPSASPGTATCPGACRRV